jgi:hypothetical protein
MEARPAAPTAPDFQNLPHRNNAVHFSPAPLVDKAIIQNIIRIVGPTEKGQRAFP